MKNIAICIFSVGLLVGGTQAAEDEWQYQLTPYLWFAGLKGDVATVPPLPSAPIDVSASDAVKDTETSLMFLFDAKKNRHGINLGLTYTDVRSKEEVIPDPINLSVRSTTKTTIATVAYEYEAYRSGRTVVDIMAGARYWSIDSKVKLSGGLGIVDGQAIKHKKSWVDPVVGVKGVTFLGDSSRIYVAGSAGLGGFGVGSDLFYDLSLNLGYQWTDAISTAIGYRFFDVDYDNSDFLFDVKQQGFLLSLTWGF